MRKTGAILFLLLFVFAQYAKQIRYLECKWAVLTDNESAACDCAKVAGLDKADTRSNNPGHLHTKIYTEELFHTTGSITLQRHWVDRTAKYSRTGLSEIPEGLIPAPWHPPCRRTA